MWIEQLVRLRLDQATFRRWFFIGLLLLGVYLAGRGSPEQRRTRDKSVESGPELLAKTVLLL